MADYYTQFSVLFPVGAAENVGPALALYRQLADELDENDEAIGFLADTDGPSTSAHLWLHSDESGEPEHVILFALRCAEAFSLTGLWGFRWALTCSKPRLDGYGGGAQLLDLGKRESLEWEDCDQWIAEQLDRRECSTGAAERAEHILGPVVASQGWTEATQACELLEFVNQEIAADPAVAGRLRAFLAEVAEPHKMLCRECGEPAFIAVEGTSHHWGEGMDGIDHDRDRDHTAIADAEG